ncbi:MAG: DUF1015 domain-containing protein [Planctomycetota bacterium]|nr:DUF1015 domain-containing protein [Planctomycetota bacterium]
MEVRAFRGWRYDPEAGDPAKAISPPYDVIDDASRRRLCEQSRHNIVQVIRPEPGSSETDRDNRYTRAAELFRGWRQEGVLKQDDEPTIYVYGQTFDVAGVMRTRLGMIALARLEEFGTGVRAHEKTMGGPKEDRLRLTRATRSQFGQIFVLYTDPEGEIDAILEEASRTSSLLESTGDDGIRHTLWAITEPAKVARIEKAMEPRHLLIADGHHRYETALAYASENKDLEAAQYQMMTFVNTKSEGLVILPTHRLVKGVDGFRSDELLFGLADEFDVETFNDPGSSPEGPRERLFKRLAAAEAKGEHTIGMYFGRGIYHAATLRREEALDALGGDHSADWKRLDVSILHALILGSHLRIDEAALDKGNRLEYIKGLGDGVEQAVREVDEGEGQGVFFLNPPRMDEVEAVAGKGERMPRKSTFFYPKVFSGLVINVLE